MSPLLLGLYVLASSVSSPRVSSEIEDALIIEPKVELPITWVEELLDNMTLREKVGQFFMVATYSNKNEEHFQEIDSLIINEKIGGLIFFQGDKTNLTRAIDRYQEKSEIPLLIGMDAEYGVHMRLFGGDRFPYNYTIGAANDPELTELLARMIGQECRDLGIHLNFAPVADVNSNPLNPVIGFRSYGEYPKMVAEHVSATVKGIETQGVMTSIKHFPGHGDTDSDSHYKLPIVNNSYKHINAIDFFPFRAGIRAGSSTVMIGHLNVPALDSTGTPSSLSKPIIKGYLQGELKFKGLVVSDALNMKAVSDRYGKSDVVVKAFEAGNDILLFPESIHDAIDAIVAKVESGEILLDELNERCRKVLVKKYQHIVKPCKYQKYTEKDKEIAIKRLYEKAITVIKNENKLLPVQNMNRRIAHVSIGGHTNELAVSMDKISKVDHFHYYSGAEASKRFKNLMTNYDVVITSFHAKSVLSSSDYGLPDGWRNWLKDLPESKEHIVMLFGNPYALTDVPLDNIETVVVGYENHPVMLERAGQFVMGGKAATGILPVSIGTAFKQGRGINVEWGGKISESEPEELGISRNKLNEIDKIIEDGIKAHAFPGCQVLVAVNGNLVFEKAYGHHTYNEEREVKTTDLYDIASITKIAASTLSLMYLESNGEFSLEGRLKDYIPSLVENTSYLNMRVKDMLAHQAGLHPWIPFYTATLKNYRPDTMIYASAYSEDFPDQVANNMWIRKHYKDLMYQEILRTSLKSRKYKYSDLGYYFMKVIIEKKTGKSMDQFVNDQFYASMGLKNIMYRPLDRVGLDRIPPTENDTIFRKQLIHGFVHDQGASMMGGVGGHAGLFANARDLAAIMQLFLNKGKYGGKEYISPEVIDKYTGCQFCPRNRRGAGFDKPTTDRNGGPTTKLAPLSSFGHSGFTGTLAWADPEYKVNYIFLSNRVYPDAENWKIIKMDIRTEIQRIIYEAVMEADKKQ